ncbi:MAG: tetratricopeptide repeat protein [Methylophilales bacterium]|nr:tetratricopeptide repeat protein [Methylophilales bacterium]
MSLQTALHYHQNGQFAEAKAAYRRVLQTDPNNAPALHLLGLLAYQLDDYAAAIRDISKAISLHPYEADYYSNLGLAQRAHGELQQAAESYRKGLALTPHDADMHNNLGAVLHALDDFKQAITAYNQALRLSPDDVDIKHNLGHALRGLGWLALENGQLHEALSHYQAALQLVPDDAIAHYNLGNILRGLGRFNEAEVSYRTALRFNADDADTHNNLGNVLREIGRLDEAIACYRQALVINPKLHHAKAHLLHQLQYICDWRELSALTEDVHNLIQNVPTAQIPPFVMLALPSINSAEQKQCAENWAHIQFDKLQVPNFSFEREPKAKIKLGYLSADFHEHATAYLMSEVFELHDRNRFETIAYSYGPDDRSAMRQRLSKAFDHFEDVRSASNIEIASRIHQDGVDILLDLKGYTAHNRAQILAFKPAPIQVNYLGYPGTMGTTCVDYLIGDPIVTPPGHAHVYTEQLVLLPNSYQPNDRKRPLTNKPGRAECGLPETGFVFCGFNQTFKILPEIFTVWMRLLREVPDSVLWLLQANRWAENNLKREAEAQGVAASRLIFAPRLSLEQHLARQQQADLLLDTLPYNAHTTTSDALWASVPVVTCMGETFAGRVAASLLNAVGLPELITHNLQDYAALALKLARQPDELARLKKVLMENRNTSPLFDAVRFTRDLEEVYEKMWQHWLDTA